MMLGGAGREEFENCLAYLSASRMALDQFGHGRTQVREKKKDRQSGQQSIDYSEWSQGQREGGLITYCENKEKKRCSRLHDGYLAQFCLNVG
jgi:hypothetical protein